MQKNITAILIVICIILISALFITGGANGVKIKKAQMEIALLNDRIAQKEGEVAALKVAMKEKEDALNQINGELENTKRELSNTVLKLQALPASK